MPHAIALPYFSYAVGQQQSIADTAEASTLHLVVILCLLLLICAD